MVARVAPAASAGQGQCEVLDLSLWSTYYSLPTNLTIKPTAPGWSLDFALALGEGSPTACVRMEQKQSTVRLLLYKGDCKDGNLMDYNFLNNVSVLPHAWTSLALDVKRNSVLVKGPGADPIPLKATISSLPRDSLHVTVAQGVEAAVGCRVNCPQYRRASEGIDKRKNVMNSQQDDVLFYFRPGKEFVRLEYEVSCTTVLGHKVFMSIADIVPPDHLPRGLWHLVELQRLGGVAEVRLNYKLLKQKEFPHSCTFNEHIIRVMGDSLFSFSCNPTSGEAEWVEDGHWECSTGSQPSTMHPGLAACLALLIETSLIIVVYSVVVIVRNMRRSDEKVALKV